MAIEIKVGQIWLYKHGKKRNRPSMTIIKKLNAKCWEVEHSNTFLTEIRNDSQIREDYVPAPK